MSTYSKPLSYESSKCVLQYMSLDMRSLISSRCPSLRTADRISPVNLDYLQYRYTSVTVNDVKYYLGMIIEPTNGEMSDAWKAKIQSGGLKLEVDENGEMLMEDAPEASGDLRVGIGFEGRFFPQEPWDGEPPIRIDAYFEERTLNDWDDENDDEDDPKYRCELNRGQEKKLKYKSHVRLTVTSPRGVYTNRCPNGMRLHEALKKVTDFLFKGRPMFYVKKLSFRPRFIDTHATVRLPQGFKMRIQELELEENGNDSFEALKTIVDKESFPLKIVTITGGTPQDRSYHHPTVLEAEKVIIESWDNTDDWTKTILRYKNPQVHLYKSLWPKDQVYFVRKWAETEPSIGRTILFGFRQPLYLLVLFAFMIQRLDAKPGILKNEEMRCLQFPFCLTYPINEASEINISGVKGPNHEEELEKEYGKPWTLKLEVVPIGTAADDIQ